MDELIRELEQIAANARRRRNLYTPDQITWQRNDQMAQDYDHAANLAHEAKRRMAEQAPAWELG